MDTGLGCCCWSCNVNVLFLVGFGVAFVSAQLRMHCLERARGGLGCGFAGILSAAARLREHYRKIHPKPQ